MRTTLTITVDQDLADFIHRQPGVIDPSAFINKLIHDDIRKQNISPGDTKNNKADKTVKELELSLDEQIPAAG